MIGRIEGRREQPRKGCSLATCLDIQCNVVGLDPFGQVEQGFLHLEGPIVEGTLPYAPRDTFGDLVGPKVSIEENLISTGCSLDVQSSEEGFAPRLVKCLFVLHQNIEEIGKEDVFPLLPAPSLMSPNTFERVGMAVFKFSEEELPDFLLRPEVKKAMIL